MEKVVIFQFEDYKDYLRTLFQKPVNRGLMTEAAENIQCGRSYLSRVLNEKMDLSLDQGFRLSQFLGHSSAETEYFHLCIDLARAQSKEYREHLRQKIETAQNKFEESQKKGQHPVLSSSESEIEYYSQWFMIPLHLMTSFKGGMTIKQASHRLKVPEFVIESGLQYLAKLGLISAKNEKYFFKDGAKYLPKNHPLLFLIQRSLREQALFHSQYQTASSLHFSVWQTLNQTDYQKIRDLLLGAIEKVNKVAQPSPSEKVVGLSIDLFDPFDF
jgi:hypothetical protein